MEPMDFDSFVRLINEMSETKKVESPLSQLTSEELALIKAFDPDLVDEISAGKITSSEAVLLARSATSNQEQEHAIKENDSECANSALSGIFEAAEQRLENNREEAKKLKEEADAETEEDSDEGISDEEWQEGLDKKYEEIYNDKKLSPNVADQVDLSNPKMHFKSAQDSDVQYVMDNDIPCAFWDYDEDWVEAGLLHAIDGMGNFIKDDETVWVHCAILDNVRKSSFNPKDPLDDFEDYKKVDESEDEIIVEEEMYFIPELKGKVGKIWQGEPTTDFNEAFEQALAESYLHEDSIVVIRDSLNRNVLLDEGKGIWNFAKGLIKSGSKTGKEALKTVDKTVAKPVEKQLSKFNKWFNGEGKAAKAGKGDKGAKAKGGSNALKTAGTTLSAGTAGGFLGSTANDIAGAVVDQLANGATMVMNTIDTLSQQGSGISDTQGTTNGSTNDIKLTA